MLNYNISIIQNYIIGFCKKFKKQIVTKKLNTMAVPDPGVVIICQSLMQDPKVKISESEII